MQVCTQRKGKQVELTGSSVVVHLRLAMCSPRAWSSTGVHGSDACFLAWGARAAVDGPAWLLAGWKLPLPALSAWLG